MRKLFQRKPQAAAEEGVERPQNRRVAPQPGTEGGTETEAGNGGAKRRVRVRTNGMGQVVRDLLSGEFLTQQGVTRNIPYLVFVSALFLLYIGMGYHFERIEREKVNARRKIEELNAEFKTLQADFEMRRQQSRLEAEMVNRGLVQPQEPPHLLQWDGKITDRR